MADFTYKPTKYFEPRVARVGFMAYSKPQSDGRTEIQCSHKPCGVFLTQKQLAYSMRTYGKPICYGHQRKYDALSNLTEK